MVHCLMVTSHAFQPKSFGMARQNSNHPGRQLKRHLTAAILIAILIVLTGLSGCATRFPPADSAGAPSSVRSAKAQASGREIALFSFGLLDTQYRFGGKNPEAGLDCSGMVSYVYQNALDIRVKGSASDIARQARPVERQSLLPGDLLFFNTRNAPYTHVGIYLGEDRFIHAPSSRGSVRIEKLSNRYFAERLHDTRTLLD